MVKLLQGDIDPTHVRVGDGCLLRGEKEEKWTKVYTNFKERPTSVYLRSQPSVLKRVRHRFFQDETEIICIVESKDNLVDSKEDS